jgi:hypothetical protein
VVVICPFCTARMGHRADPGIPAEDNPNGLRSELS